ncbi:MAG: S26 family signal peptidase [Pirellulaceae bacterium]|nr:S26 family signal peptidase [Pirellulaceae bacterium]
MNRRRHSLLIFFTGLLFGLAIARIFCWQGVVAPIHVVSGSMVPTLRGPHFAVVCEDCEFSFQCDATSAPETGDAVCPNCGFSGNPLTQRQLRLGQRVVIDRFPYLLRMPRRWDLVAFQDPLVPAAKAVKRVVGLPGETVAIRQGDLFVDGQIVRKPIDVQRSMAVLVHDDLFRPARTRDLPLRWDAAQEQSGWESSATGYQFLPRANAGQVDWLKYRSWRCFASPLERSEETPVLDHYGYNQNTSRELHAVGDLTLSCRVRWSSPSRLWLSVRDGRDSFEVELDRGRHTATLRREDVVIGNRFCSLTDACNLEFGICDRQVFLTVNRRVAFRESFEPSERLRQPTASPLALGGDRGELMIGDLKVYRDVYYLEPHGRSQDWTMRTQPEGREILVLGDNVPISRDSRRWSSTGLSHKSLIGRVLMPF